jgi:membrane fusion protein
MSKSLFRTEALNAQRVNNLGNIILVRPISFTLMAIIAASFAIFLIVLLICGCYTKRSTVSGQLIPNTGLVQIYPPQSGIIVQKHVEEGQAIKQGDILYVLSSERESSTQGATQNAISEQVVGRVQSLRDELVKTQTIHQDDRAAQGKKVADLRAELSLLGDQIQIQNSRVMLAQQILARYQSLSVQDYISKEQFQQKQEDLLDQRTRQQALERDKISVGRELDSQISILNSMSLTQQNQRLQLDRQLSSTRQELSESEAKRRLVISASESGIATAVNAEVGQSVDPVRPVLSIVPSDSVLQAQLYAPSKAIGFIKPGAQVLLRYQAYPYQKFGHAKGVVISVAKTALPSAEIANINLPANSAGQLNEPVYRITVKLNQQTIQAYGKPQTLQAGMLLEADILQEKRHLYEWVLEPLYSLTGKL